MDYDAKQDIDYHLCIRLIKINNSVYIRSRHMSVL